MKPSQRIREIADKQGIPNHEAVPAWIIASYLDEEYEKNKPCEHEWDTAGECDFCGKFCGKKGVKTYIVSDDLIL